MLAVDHLPLEGEARLPRLPLHHVQVGVGDELEAHRDERVVDLPLPLELGLVLVLLRQRVLHLLEPVVVQPRRVHVDAGELRPARPAHLDRQVDRPVGVVRVVHRNADVLEHGSSPSIPAPYFSSKSTVTDPAGGTVISRVILRASS